MQDHTGKTTTHPPLLIYFISDQMKYSFPLKWKVFPRPNEIVIRSNEMHRELQRTDRWNPEPCDGVCIIGQAGCMPLEVRGQLCHPTSYITKLCNKKTYWITQYSNVQSLYFAVFLNYYRGPSWSWSYGSWIYNYLCNWWVRISIRSRCTTLCDKVCQRLATGRWFSPGPPVSSTNKTDRHDITEIMLKVALNTTKQTNNLRGFSIGMYSVKLIFIYKLLYFFVFSKSSKIYHCQFEMHCN